MNVHQLVEKEWLLLGESATRVKADLGSIIDLADEEVILFVTWTVLGGVTTTVAKDLVDGAAEMRSIHTRPVNSFLIHIASAIPQDAPDILGNSPMGEHGRPATFTHHLDGEVNTDVRGADEWERASGGHNNPDDLRCTDEACLGLGG